MRKKKKLTTFIEHPIVNPHELFDKKWEYGMHSAVKAAFAKDYSFHERINHVDQMINLQPLIG